MAYEEELIAAVKAGGVAEVESLLRRGASPHTVESDGWPVLCTAVLYGHLEVVKVLVAQGANVRTPNKNGVTPMYIAAQEGKVESLQWLFEHGAKDVRTPKNTGVTPMYIAAQEGKVDALQWLFEHGAKEDVRTPRNDGATPMFIAAQEGKVESLQWLFEHGAQEDVRTPNKDGRTPMFIAAQEGKVEAVKWLYHHGADETVKTQWGTALEIARRSGHAEIVDFLEHPPRRQIEVEAERQKEIEERKRLEAKRKTRAEAERKAKAEAERKAKQPHSPAAAPRADKLLDEDGTVRYSIRIAYKDLTLEEKELGAGGFGKVYKGTWKYTPVAVKQLHLQQMSPDVKEEFQREASFMVGLRHPNIVQLYGVCLDPGHYGMVMELMLKGSLYDVLHNAGEKLDWKMRWEIGMDVGQGLAVLHSEGVLHRDLKSLNVLLDDRMRAKLTDFGLSRVKTESVASTRQQSVGTLMWMAPELFKRKAKYTQGADVYSYGMILWELASRKIPYADAASPAVIAQWIQAGETEEIPADCPETFGQVVKTCWAMEPESRPTAAKVVEQLRAGLEQHGLFGRGAGGGAAAVSRPQYDMNTRRPGQSGAGYR